MLYEPTNITPSTLNGTGAVDVNDNVNISWQVNGNSKLTGFKIDVYTNEPTPTQVHTTGQISASFYGRNQLGDVQLFTYSPNVTWASWGLANGNQYKFRITQYFDSGSVEQRSFSAFNTYSTPTVTVSVSNNEGQSVSGTLTTSIFNATAGYTQAQGSNIQSVRWQLSENGTVIDDTGFIETADLQYEYGGAQEGNEYSLLVTVVSEAGQMNTAVADFTVRYDVQPYDPNFTAKCVCREDANILSWELLPSTSIFINGNATGEYLIKNNRLILPEGSSVTWDKVQVGDQLEEEMNFPAPWTAIWNGKHNPFIASDFILLAKQNTNSNVYPVQGALNGDVSGSAFSPDGTLFVIAGAFEGAVSVYRVINNNFKYLQDLKDENAQGFDIREGFANNRRAVYCDDIKFCPNGELLIVALRILGATSTTTKYYLYKVSNGDIDNYAFSSISFDGQDGIAFSPDGTLCVLCNVDETLTTQLELYSVVNSSLVQRYYNGTTGSYPVFSPDGRFLVVSDSSSISFYSVHGTTLSLSQTLTGFPNTNSGEKIFSPDGTKMISIRPQYGDGIIYNISYNPIAAIYKESIGVPLNSRGGIITGTDILVLGGGDFNSGMVATYQLGDSVTSIETIQRFNGRVNTVSLGNDLLFMGGEFNGYGGFIKFSTMLITYFHLGELSARWQYPLITLKNGEEVISSFQYLLRSDEISLALTPTKIVANGFNGDSSLGTVGQDIPENYQTTIDGISLIGEQTTNYFSIISGDGEQILESLSSPDFNPFWNNGGEYEVNFLAKFTNGLDAGTGATSNNGFMLYRTDGVSGTRRELLRLPSTVPKLKDYGLRSNEEYTYTFYAYDSNGAFIGETEQTVQGRQFKHYSLLATKYSDTDGCYHVYKEYQFGCNVQNMSVSNNANSSYVQNFTPYPTRMYSSANYASGTLQALIGFVDLQANLYFDSTKLMDELNALSTADHVLFLKDMKGHIRMVAPSGAVTQTANIKTKEMEVTISFPWIEIGDASKVSIVQLPTDEGWNNGAQLLDVKIGVDYNTGELIVTYPFPYYGTKFLYNNNSGTLGTITPADVTPRNVTLDTNPESSTSGAVLADKTNNGGNG